MGAFIYTLACPLSGKVIYVGKTVHSLKLRLQNHINSSAVKSVFRYIVENKIIPIIEELEYIETGSAEEITQLEYYWIDQFRQWGFVLLNRTGNTSFNINYHPITNDLERSKVSIRIQASTYTLIKKIVKEHPYTIAGFADRAIMEKIESYRKNKSKTK